MENNQYIPIGYCQCGCGQKTSIIPKSNKKYGYIKGEYYRYCLRHNLSHQKCELNPAWKGGRVIINGYIKIRTPDHPRAVLGYVSEHVLIAEKVLGKFLPLNAQVHHVNGNKTDNWPNNLVICESASYHTFLHQRIIAKKESGDAHYRKCPLCHQWDDISNMTKRTSSKWGHYVHRECECKYKREEYASLSPEKKQIIHNRKKQWIANNLDRHIEYHKNYRLNKKKSKGKLPTPEDSSKVAG